MKTLLTVVSLIGAIAANHGLAEDFGDDYMVLEEVAVTATRLERATKDIPEAISVIGKERIDNSRMFNITDALSGTPGVLINSKSGGYDTRVLIRGGGLKANYGIREIFLMRDGVPITDPDSFTRMDFIDTQDIERIEVSKGPGNIYATGSTAGVIHLISKSVFDESANSISIAGGDYGKLNAHARLGGVGDRHAYAITASYRKADNDWRWNNEFESKQISLKYGFKINETDDLKFELSYTDVDLDLPGEMNEAQFEEFKLTGKQEDNNSFFKTKGRYSKTWFFNARYISQLTKNIEFRPRLYYTQWEQFHPVTPFIVKNDGVNIIGSDIEFLWSQDIGNLVAGLTLRSDDDGDANRYEYKDLQTNFDAILDPGEGTLSQEMGGLAQAQDTKNTVKGLFAQQSIDYFDQWIIDLSLRYDSINIKQDTHYLSEFNFPYATVFGPPSIPRRAYDPVDIEQSLDRDFSLTSFRVGVSYEISETLSAYANLASGEQVPFANELEKNPDLKESTTDSAEIGLKGRGEYWAVDLALFKMTVEDEIIAGLDENDEIYFQNAGETDKKGFELTSRFRIVPIATGELWGGINYTYSDFVFTEFTEYYEERGRPQISINDGNQLPFIPEHYYSVYLLYQNPAVGLNIRIQSDTWGEYYIDNANTETYPGYEWLTSLNINYAFSEHHSVTFNVHNIFDQRYASVVKKNAGKQVSYAPGAPRNWLLSYTYQF